ncbi:MAG: transposase [Gammaproteobacteria bacterium]|nr:transposase [Gammaproteobacteria bacterium]
MVVKGGVGAKVFIGFLKRLVHGARRPLFLIVDGHPAHRSKLVKAYVESLDGRLRLFPLPPYSPELNSDELVWNDVTNNAVGRMRVENPADLHRAIIGRLRFLQKRPDRVFDGRDVETELRTLDCDTAGRKRRQQLRGVVPPPRHISTPPHRRGLIG